MPFIPPLITCTPDAQPLYAPVAGGGGGGGVTSLNTLTGAVTLTSTDGSVVITPIGGTDVDLSVPAGGGVQTITGSANIAISGTATDPVISATGLVPASASFISQTDYLTGAVPVGGTFGITMTPGTYTAPRTGLYLFSVSCIVNVNVGVGNGFCSIGPYDDVGVTIFNIGSGFTQTVNLKPWSMPNTDAVPGGVDYIVYGSAVISLTESLIYTLAGLTVNASTPDIMVFPSSGLPGSSGAKLTASVTPLC
jgi:hypothetical protein